MPSGFPDWQPPRPSAAALFVQVGANPAAGTDWSFTVPAGEVWRPVMVTADLTIANAGVERRAQVQMIRGADTLGRFPLHVTAPINRFTQLTWARLVPPAGDSVAGGDIVLVNTLPDVTLIPGDVIRSLVVVLNAADNWGPPVLSYERLVL